MYRKNTNKREIKSNGQKYVFTVGQALTVAVDVVDFAGAVVLARGAKVAFVGGNLLDGVTVEQNGRKFLLDVAEVI